MSDLQKLLSVVDGLDETKRSKEEDAPTDEELNEAREGLLEALKLAAEGDKPNLEDARAIRAAIDAIDAEKVTRTEAVEAAKKEAAELLKGLEPETTEPEGEGTDDGDGEGNGSDDEPKPEDAKEPAAVAASLTDALRRTDKRKAEKVLEPTRVADVLVAALGPAQGHGIPQDATIDDVAVLFNQYASQVKRGGSVLVHMDRIYPEDRVLGLSGEENTRIIDNVTGLRAITAAGGICEPLPADFSHPICGDRGRPIFNANPVFRADRGGVRFGPSITVADLEEAITVWTHETDETPGSSTKACPRVECDEEQSAQVDAIVACLTVGNFQARFNPEFWRSRLDLLMVAHDRVAEQTLYAIIESGSTQVGTFTGSTGTTIDLFQALDLGVAGIDSRHRLINTQYVTILPSYVRNALRALFVGQAPAGSDDLLAYADARINGLFSARKTTPVWSPDVGVFGDQGASAIEDYPGTVDMVLYPVGTWLTLDGGTLDLGTQIVDSTLNSTNDRQAFMETFESVVKRGCESLSIPVAIAADCICPAGVS